MKIRKLGLEWGAAWEEAQAHEITHGAARVQIFVSEKGDLIIQTKEAHWKLTSVADCDVRLTLTA